jgi:uncharacterized membrane protein YbhN (UPF0104 family)
MSYSLYHQIKLQPKLNQTIQAIFTEWDSTRMLMLASVFVLMVVNWTVEAAKWRIQLDGTEKFSIIQSLQSVLTGVAVSVITPNRIGEYVGRILYLKNVNKLQGITVTIIGSFAQLIVTGFLGLVGLIYYILNIQHSAWLNVLLLSSIALCVGLTYLYFHLSKFIEWTSMIPMLRKVKIYLEIVKRFKRKQLLQILGLSFLRYLVYTLQFIILMRILLVNANLFDLLFTVWLIFWAMAIVPTIAIAEIGIRGETALFFLAPLSTNHFGIVSSSLLLWLINLIIPALIGCLFVFRMKIYDDE